MDPIWLSIGMICFGAFFSYVGERIGKAEKRRIEIEKEKKRDSTHRKVNYYKF